MRKWWLKKKILIAPSNRKVRLTKTHFITKIIASDKATYSLAWKLRICFLAKILGLLS